MQAAFYTVSTTLFSKIYTIIMRVKNAEKINFLFCRNVAGVHFAYLTTALAEGVVTQLHSVHGELPVALPAHGHDLRI
jgi:hypothetical protein